VLSSPHSALPPKVKDNKYVQQSTSSSPVTQSTKQQTHAFMKFMYQRDDKQMILSAKKYVPNNMKSFFLDFARLSLMADNVDQNF